MFILYKKKKRKEKLKYIIMVQRKNNPASSFSRNNTLDFSSHFLTVHVPQTEPLLQESNSSSWNRGIKRTTFTFLARFNFTEIIPIIRRSSRLKVKLRFTWLYVGIRAVRLRSPECCSRSPCFSP